MTRNTAVRAFIVLAASLLAACGDADKSSTIPTDRIYARFIAETSADGVSHVRAYFFEEDEPLLLHYEAVYLDGGDALAVRSYEKSLLFTGGGSEFAGDLAAGIAEDTSFQFDLQRPEHQDAPDSWGTQPAPMDLLLPESGTEYSISQDPVNVAWTYPGTIDDMYLKVDLKCAQPAENAWIERSFGVEIPGDPGAFSFDASDHMFFNDDCQRFAGTLTLYRARAGVLDEAYKPKDAECEDNDSRDCKQLGYVSIRQVRSAEIVLTP